MGASPLLELYSLLNIALTHMKVQACKGSQLYIPYSRTSLLNMCQGMMLSTG